MVVVVRNLPANGGDITEASSIPVLGRFPGGGYGNSFQYSYLKDREAWWAMVHRATESQTRLK